MSKQNFKNNFTSWHIFLVKDKTNVNYVGGKRQDKTFSPNCKVLWDLSFIGSLTVMALMAANMHYQTLQVVKTNRKVTSR